MRVFCSVMGLWAHSLTSNAAWNQNLRRIHRHLLSQRLLSGAVLKAHAWPIIDKQMPAYLGRFNPNYGILTNGEQWIGFLHRLRPGNLALEESEALVFRSFKVLRDNFEDFYDAFAFERVRDRVLARRLSPLRIGYVECANPERVVASGQERRLSYQDRGEFYQDLQQAMRLAFKPIVDNPDALIHCFVDSTESRSADARLERMVNELQVELRAASEYTQDVADELDDARNAPPWGQDELDRHRGQGFLARLLGEPSSGKSVFLKRLLTGTLSSRRAELLLIWLDGEKLSPFEPHHASREAIAQAESALFGPEGPGLSQYRELTLADWRRELAAYGVEETSERAAEVWHRFVEARRREREDNPALALQRLLDFALKNRRKLPIIVVDNIDQVDQADAAVRWTVALYRSTFALTTVAMEDTTLWRLRRHGQDRLAAHNPEQFWLHRPMVREVLENRLAYLQHVLTESTTSGRQTRTRLGRGGRFQWNVSADALVRVVSAVLLEEQEIANWLGELCNFDIAELLSLCEQILLSPHLKAEELLAMQVTGSAPSLRWRVLKAIISPQSHQFLAQPDDRVSNIFSFWSRNAWAPLLPARLLAVLRGREDGDRVRREPFPGFMTVTELQKQLQTHLGIPIELTRAAIDALLTGKLLESHAPDQANVDHLDLQVKITPRGRVHLDWATRERTYVRMMAEVDPIADQAALCELRDAWRTFIDAFGGPERSIAAAERSFIEPYVRHLLEAATRVSATPAHPDMAGVEAFERALQAAWVPAPGAASEVT